MTRGTKKRASQAEFDVVVEENVVEFDMTPEDAAADALAQMPGDTSLLIVTEKDRRLAQVLNDLASNSKNVAALVDFVAESCATSPPVLFHAALSGIIGMILADARNPESPFRPNSLKALNAVVEVFSPHELDTVFPSHGMSVLVSGLNAHKDDPVRALQHVRVLHALAAGNEMNKQAAKEAGVEEALWGAYASMAPPAPVNKMSAVSTRGIAHDAYVSSLLRRENGERARTRRALLGYVVCYVDDDDEADVAPECFSRARSIANLFLKPLVVATGDPRATDAEFKALTKLVVNDALCRRCVGSVDQYCRVLASGSEKERNRVSPLLKTLAGCDDVRRRISATSVVRTLQARLYSQLEHHRNTTDYVLGDLVHVLGSLFLRDETRVAEVCEACDVVALLEDLLESDDDVVRRATLICARNLVSRSVHLRPDVSDRLGARLAELERSFPVLVADLRRDLHVPS